MRARKAKTVLILLGALLLAAPAARAEDEEPKSFSGSVSERVAEAFHEGDLEQVAAIAKEEGRDPWAVVGALCVKGEIDAAAEYASHCVGPDVNGIETYVAGQRDRPPPKEAHDTVRAALPHVMARRFDQAVAALGDAEPPLDTVTGVQWNRMRSYCLLYLRQREEAIELAKRGGQAAERMGWLSMAGNSYRLVATAAFLRSDFKTAVEYQRRQLVIVEALGDEEQLADVRGNLGMNLSGLGRNAEGRKFLELALAYHERVGDRSAAAWVLDNLGGIDLNVGEPEIALERFEAAHALYVDLGDPYWAGRTLDHIGAAHFALGNVAEALAAHEGALEFLQKARIKRDIATSLANIGMIYELTGDLDAALDYTKQALSILEGTGHRIGVAQKLGRLGSILKRLGRLEESLSAHEASLKLFEDIGDPWGIALSTINVGVLRLSLGDRDAAIRCYERAVEVSEAAGNAQMHAGAYLKLAHALKEQGDLERAAVVAERGLGIAEESRSVYQLGQGLVILAELRRVAGRPREGLALARRLETECRGLLGGMSASRGAMSRESQVELFEEGLLCALALDDPAELAHSIEFARAGTLLEALLLRRTLESTAVPPGLLEQEAAARTGQRDAREALRVATESGKLMRAREARKAVDAADAALADVVDRIERHKRHSAGLLDVELTSLEDLSQALRPDECYVSFYAAPGAAGALVTTAKVSRIVRLGDPAAFEKRLAPLLALDQESDVESVARVLRKELVAALDIPEGVRRVLICPEGATTYLPWSLLLPGREVCCIPSGSVYARLRDEPRPEASGVLAVGDPAYGGEATATRRGLHRGLTLARLPHTRAEAEEVGTTTLLGADASEARLLEHLKTRQRWKAVHLACHGLVDAVSPVRSSLALTPDSENDGFLTVLDLFRMSVPADLVTLSACDTGRGKVYRGEGLMGLARGFMFAGAPRVICSLWKVDDEATRALMVKFYELWNPKDGSPGLGAAAALRKAQDHVRSQERWRHPYYWAAWVLWGLPD